MKKIFIIIIGVIVLGAVGAVIIYAQLFGAPQEEMEEITFVVGQNDSQRQIIEKLHDKGLIRNAWAFQFVLSRAHGEIAAGGYNVSKDMSTRELVERLVGEPDMKWITFPEGLRKEQIGERLADVLGWDGEALEKWNTTYTQMNIDYIEGTYFPDTYLIPVDEDGLDIATRMTRNFDERFAPYVAEFTAQNIKWTTGLTLASIVQREMAGAEDASLIAGILWNRLLNTDMKLEVDATVQYAREKTDTGWWAPITRVDIDGIDSPYNTYMYDGLPPHPICNPGVVAIEAVLYPAETECLYYIHDNDRQIHCAKTFEEHNANIDQYLRN